MKKPILLIVLTFIITSCISDPVPSLFGPPRIDSISSNIENNEVILTCKISGNKRIEEYGFRFGTDEENLEKIICKDYNGGIFTMRFNNLTFNVDYYFSSFISNGKDELSSSVKHLKIPQQSPQIELKPIVDRTSERIVTEYSVSENFSGELIVCGVCWGTEPNPTIETTSKTIDSAQYGAHSTEISGLTIGKTYYLRAYAINAKGTVYSNEQTFYIPVTFKDKAFTEYILGIADTDEDGYISIEEARSIHEIKWCTDKVKTFSGIEFCTGLTKIELFGSSEHSGKLSEFDLSPYLDLEYLDLRNNLLSTLNLSSNTRLKELDLSNNYLNTLIFPSHSGLETIDVSNNKLKTLNVSNFSLIKDLKVTGNPLSSMILPLNCLIESLDLENTNISGLNDIFKRANHLKRLNVPGVFTDSDKLYFLPELEELICCKSSISTIDLRYNRLLKKLDIRNCTSLGELDICVNDKLESLDCSGCSSLKTIYMVETQRIIGINANLENGSKKPESTSIVYSAKIEDSEFARFLTDMFDKNYDDFVSIREAENVEEMLIDNSLYRGISSLHGLEMFRSLRKLSIPGQDIRVLDLSSNAMLSELICDSNPLSSINLQECSKLRLLYCQSTSLTSIDLSGCKELEKAYLFNSQFTELDLSECSVLKVLDCSNCPKLTRVIINKNCANSVKISKDTQTEVVISN